MSNKVTNIYIDTTGFCKDAMGRVNRAFSTIIDSNGLEEMRPAIHKVSPRCFGFDGNGAWHSFFPQIGCCPCTNASQVGLWGLESIAFRCRQEKNEDPLPTRNIYIDARQLDFDDRLSAFNKINSISNDSHVAGGWLPSEMALDGRNVDAFVLCDIFEIDSNGDSAFYLRKGDMDEFYRENRDLELPVELTLNQLMSLTR